MSDDHITDAGKKVCPECGAECIFDGKLLIKYDCLTEYNINTNSWDYSHNCRINTLTDKLDVSKAETDQLKFELTIAASVIRKFKAEIAELRKFLHFIKIPDAQINKMLQVKLKSSSELKQSGKG